MLITINGETKTPAEWARLSGVPRATVVSRVKLGWAGSKIIEPINHNNTKGKTFITINGVTKTPSEWAKLSGVSRTTIISRVKLGWTGEVILQAEKANAKTAITIDEVTKTISEWAKTTGIPRPTLAYRYNVLGLTGTYLLHQDA